MAIVFDMDGTLIASMPMWSGIGDKYVRSLGIPVREKTELVVTDRTYNEMVQQLIDRYGLTGNVAEVKAKFDEMVERCYRCELQLKPYVREYLEQCHADGIPMSVATATASPLALACFERLDILKYFTVVLSTRDTGVNKFSPDIYLRCAAAMGAEPADTLVFEDALYAATTAAAAGFPVVGVYDEVFDGDYEKLKKVSRKTVKSFAELLRRGE